MALYTYLAFTRAVPGRGAEFDRWYDERHIADVAKMPGIVSAKRFYIDWQEGRGFDAPDWRSLAIYEIDSEDPQATLTAIRAVAGTEVMPLTDAMTKVGMLQFLVRPASTITERD